MTRPACRRSAAKAAFQLERRSGLRNPDDRLVWAEDLVAKINRHRSQEGISAVGHLSIACTRHEDVTAALLQFRSGPLAGCGDGEFRFEISHGHGHRHERAILKHLCEAERRVVVDQSKLAGIMRHARETALHIIGRQDPDHPPASMDAISCVFAIRAPMRLQVDLRSLGHRLDPGVDRVCGGSLEEFEHELERAVSWHARRHRLRSALPGPEGGRRVDASVAPLLAHAGMDIGFALDHLERREELRFTCGKGRALRARLAWHEGVLRCDFKDHTLGLAFSGDELTIGGRPLPDVVLAALPGRRLDALMLHPCLPPDAVIVSAKNYLEVRGGVNVALEPSSAPLRDRRILDQEAAK